MTFRTFAAVAAAFLVVSFYSSTAFADPAFPQKQVRLIVAVSPGASADKLARTIAQELAKKWGQTVVVENLPGASQSIGFNTAARSRPDGYTIALGTDQLALDIAFGRKLPYDSRRDLRAITRAVVNSLILVVRPGLGVNNLDEFVALARQRPGEITVGLPGGVGSSQHLALTLLTEQLGVKTNPIPYPGGGPIILDILGGHLDATMITLAAVSPHVLDGKIIPVGVTTPERSKALPDVPTFQELGVKDYSFATWQGFIAPGKTPDAIIQKLYQDLAAVLKDPDVSRQLEELGFNIFASTPEEADRLIAEDIRRFSRIAKEAGIVLE